LVLILTSLFLWNLEYGNVVKGLNSNDKIDRMSCEQYLNWSLYISIEFRQDKVPSKREICKQ
jgi:hypothetical protein